MQDAETVNIGVNVGDVVGGFARRLGGGCSGERARSARDARRGLASAIVTGLLCDGDVGTAATRAVDVGECRELTEEELKLLQQL